jgi:hypothetical protein
MSDAAKHTTPLEVMTTRQRGVGLHTETKKCL